MSKTPGRKPTAKTSPTSKSQLSADGKILKTLIEKQPLTKQEICQKTKISEPTFYRRIRVLMEFKIVKSVEQEYALFNFEPLETLIENAFMKLFTQPPDSYFCTHNNIASEIGMPWQQIETQTLKVAKRLNSYIVPKDDHTYKFYKPGVFKNP